MVSFILLFPNSGFAKTTVETKMPSSVLNISKDNTFPNDAQDLPRLQPSKFAQELLKTTNLQIQTIAQYCGIVDVHYFTRLFKKTTGVSPKQYREENSK